MHTAIRTNKALEATTYPPATLLLLGLGAVMVRGKSER
jgi:hypothetical protein